MAARQQFNPKLLLGLSFSSLALLYSIMMFGVYISSSNLGLTCKEWPFCPNGIGWPSEKHLFEHVHRMIAIITAGVIIATAAYTAKNIKAARKTAIAAAVIVLVQIMLGMFVVNTSLEPIIVAVHLATGVLLFAMTLMTFLSSYRIARNSMQKI